MNTVYVGIKIDEPEFAKLPRADRDYIANLTHIPTSGVQPILEHFDIVGYGIPVTEPHRLNEAKEMFNHLTRSQKIVLPGSEVVYES